jgi:hypothetical protein
LKHTHLFYAGIVATLLALFIPLLCHTYFSLDEPNILWTAREGTAWTDYYYRFLGEGRPVYGLLQIGGIILAKHFSGFWIMRLLSLLLTLAFCILLFYYLRKLRFAEPLAFMTAALVFTLPGFSVFICWAEHFPHHLSSLFSFLSGMILVQVFLPADEDLLHPRKTVSLKILAGTLQLVSLMIYQGMALSILLPVFFVLLIRKDLDSNQRFRLFFLVTASYLVFLCVYYMLFKFMLNELGLQVTTRGELGADLAGKADWFGGILAEASKLHLLLLKKLVVKYTFSILLVLLLVRDLIKKRFLDIAFLFIFCVLVFLPHLLIRESWGASRNFNLIAILFVFYLVLRSFELIPIPSRNISLICVLPFLAMMYYSVKEGWLRPQEIDYKTLQTFVNTLPELNKQHILVEVKLPEEKIHERDSPLKLYYDEFNACVLFPGWPVGPAIKVLYSDSHPGISVAAIDKQLNIVVPPDTMQEIGDPKATRILELDLRTHRGIIQ